MLKASKFTDPEHRTPSHRLGVFAYHHPAVERPACLSRWGAPVGTLSPATERTRTHERTTVTHGHRRCGRE